MNSSNLLNQYSSFTGYQNSASLNNSSDEIEEINAFVSGSEENNINTNQEVFEPSMNLVQISILIPSMISSYYNDTINKYLSKYINNNQKVSQLTSSSKNLPGAISPVSYNCKPGKTLKTSETPEGFNNYTDEVEVEKIHNQQENVGDITSNNNQKLLLFLIVLIFIAFIIILGFNLPI